MFSAILPFVLSVVTVAAPVQAPAAAGAEPAVRVTLNHRSYDRGDHARVTARVANDGYVVILHADPNGHVRVLFPVDPADDNFMKAGRDYEIRGRGDRDAFQVTETGSGTVYAAVSADPYHFNDFARNDHWDYNRLDDSAVVADPEAGMTSLVEAMADGNHFDYDVATYTAEAAYASRGYDGGYGGGVYGGGGSYGCFYGSFDPWCGGYYPSPSYFSVGFGFGGFGGFYGYRPYGYGYGYGFGYPGYGYPYYGGGYYRGGYGYGAAGYGYTVGRGWTYNHGPINLGPNGGYYANHGLRSGFALGGAGAIGYRNRGNVGLAVNNTASPLYRVGRFNAQPVRSPSRGGGYIARPSDVGGMRPASRGGDVIRVSGQPAAVERSSGGQRVEAPRGASAPTRVEPSTQQRGRQERGGEERRSGGGERRSGGGEERRGGGGGGGERRGGGGHPSGGGGGRRH